MSKTAPQRGRHTVARHGALKSPHPFSVFMKALGIVVAVVLVSGTGVAAYTVYDLAASYATENTVELICVLLMTLFFCGVTAYVVVNNALEKAGEARESFVNTKVRTLL